ncbi:MAG TPA: type VI secretion system tube protein Hcp [Caulobacteraceae bacterium]
MAIYMKIDGVTGTVTEPGHKDWIEINSFQWGVGRGISTAVGNANNRESTTPSISEITVTHSMDKSSINLFDLAVADAKGKKFEIDFTKTATGTGNAEAYLHYELENCMISGYSISSGGDLPSESISLNFTKITEKFTEYTAENANGTPTVKGFNLVEGKPF